MLPDKEIWPLADNPRMRKYDDSPENWRRHLKRAFIFFSSFHRLYTPGKINKSGEGQALMTTKISEIWWRWSWDGTSEYQKQSLTLALTTWKHHNTSLTLGRIFHIYNAVRGPPCTWKGYHITHQKGTLWSYLGSRKEKWAPTTGVGQSLNSIGQEKIPRVRHWYISILFLTAYVPGTLINKRPGVFYKQLASAGSNFDQVFRKNPQLATVLQHRGMKLLFVLVRGSFSSVYL